MKSTGILFVDFQRDFLEANGRLTIGAMRAAVILIPICDQDETIQAKCRSLLAGEM